MQSFFYFAKICQRNNALLTVIKEYRQQILLRDDLPQADETQPLVISWRTGKVLTPRYINTLLKKLASETAKHFSDVPLKQNKLQRFSAHWLRHLSATMQERAGIGESYIMANMRHENMATTKLYGIF